MVGEGVHRKATEFQVRYPSSCMGDDSLRGVSHFKPSFITRVLDLSGNRHSIHRLPTRE